VPAKTIIFDLMPVIRVGSFTIGNIYEEKR
jgi:hypothetical protein